MALVAVGLASVAGCNLQFGGSDNHSYVPLDKLSIPSGFRFASSRSVLFSLTVSGIGESDTLVPYVGPLQCVLQTESGDEILGTGWTDSAGKTEFQVGIPTSVTSVVLRPAQTSIDGLYILSDFTQALEPGTTKVTRTLQPVLSSATVTAGVAATGSRAGIPFVDSSAGYRMLSSYDSSLGVPTGLIVPRPSFSFKQSFIRNVSFTFPESKKIPDSYIDSGDLTNIILDASATVTVTMASENTAAKNAIGYFVRTKSSIPNQASDIAASDIVIIFPNASLSGSGGGLYQGDSIELRNPVSSSPNYQTTTFDKDMVISWILIPEAFLGGVLSEPKGRYCSIPALNPESGTNLQRAHVAQLLYNKPPYNLSKSFFLLGFEDALRSVSDDGYYNDDFNDVMLTVQVTPSSAASMMGLPVVKDETQVGDLDRDGALDAFDEYPSDPKRSFSVAYPSRTGWGTVMYEDRWPSLGDYDFNDLVVDFRFTTVGNAAGAAVDLVGDFNVRAAGGELRSGLAYSLPVGSGSIASVSYSLKQVDSALFKPGANGAETTGDRSSIPVFSDAHVLFGLAAGVKEFVNTDPTLAVRSPVSLRVTTSFSAASPVAAAAISGAAPDIFLAGLLDLQGRTGMRKEIHTLDAKPTLLADRYPFHELDDRSPESAAGEPLPEGIYYKDKRGAPWALLVPSHILYTVEKTQIASAYAHFSDWVYSGGVTNTDWYSWNKSGYADTSKLYLIER